ncbi:DUF1641 domain-containing protein [Sporosarcina siberiensis]|uniref:DUF1641 domain-containing protein n=1 Tax=Sporosarcina siberiensis TaxID=1365606 RepID=A0ABW4SGN2_9BACL
MAVPITSIKKKQYTPEQIQEQKLEELQALLAKQDEALEKILSITGELNDIGVLDAVAAMVKAKEQIAKIAVDQVSREPITNLINHVMNASAVMSSIDPAITSKLVESVRSGLNEAELYRDNDEKVGVIQLMTLLKDDDINRGLKFGLDFLKGMGRELGK